MNKYLLILFLLTVTANSSLFSQAPAIEWQNTIGGSGYDFLNAISQTSDGGYILGGYSESNISGDKTESNIGGDDYWIVKVNAAGIVEWENTIGGGNFDRLYSVEETIDGGFILGGQSLSGGGVGDKAESNIGGYDYWVVKLNSDGIITWQNTIGGSGNDQLYCAQPTSDGGYIVAGSSDSGISGDKTENRVGNTDFWVIKLNSLGFISWQNDIGGLMFDILYSAYQTTDGGYILAGTSTSGISGDKTDANYGAVDYWVVKLNATGVVVWENTYGGNLNDYLYSAIPTEDGGSILVGMSESNSSGNKTESTNGLYDYWIIKLDGSGNITWQNSIGGTGNDYVFTNPVEQTDDGGYIIAGYSQSGINGDKTEANTGSWDYWILKLTDVGAISWQTVLGGSSGDYANAISTTADGGYIIGGYSYSGITGEKTESNIGDADYWIMKLEGTGCSPFPEICNLLDDNCNGIIDEGISEWIIIYTDGPTTFCQGGSVNLLATHTGASLQWKKNGVDIPGATSSPFPVNKSGNYSAVTTSLCGTSTSTTININVNKNPNANITAGGATTFCAGGSVTLTEAPVGGSTYQWYKGASAIAGATSTNYIATTAGNYKCRVTKTASGCFKNSNTITVTVPCREGLTTDEQPINSGFEIYPNPNSGTFNFNYEAGTTSPFEGGMRG
ncbi:MAG: immunoglobulin domain-containing protein, partial [Chitinophagales bacterium]